jgi:hypothetical protein
MHARPASDGKTYAISSPFSENSAAPGAPPSGPCHPDNVAVVQRAERLDLVLGRRRDLTGDERVPTIRAHDDAAPNVVRGVAITEPHADDPAMLAQDFCCGDGLRDLDPICAAGAAEEHVVERAAAHREAEARLSGILRRPFVRPRRPEAEAPFAPKRWRPQGQHLVEDRQPVEHGNQPVATEEVRGDRGARESHALDEEDVEAALSQERRDGRSGDPGADHDDVAGVISLTHGTPPSHTTRGQSAAASRRHLDVPV